MNFPQNNTMEYIQEVLKAWFCSDKLPSFIDSLIYDKDYVQFLQHYFTR